MVTDNDELPRFFFSYGMDCGLYKGKKINGVIKTVAEDFIVTEIDCNNKLVEITKSTVLPPPSPTTPSTATPTTTIPITKQEILTEDQIVSLQKLSQKWKEFAAIETTTPLYESVDLGCHDDKTIRMGIHTEVKNRFPSLITKTTQNEDANGQMVALPDSDYQRLLPLLGPQETLKFLRFVKLTDFTSGECYSISVPTNMTNEEQNKIHQTIKELYGLFLVTKTINAPSLSSSSSFSQGQEKIIVKFKLQKHRKTFKKVKTEEEESSSFYTRFALKKENIETLQAMYMLASSLGAKPSQFKAAGNKDRRAITLQYMTAKDISIARLSSVICPGLELGSFKYVKRSMSLGDLNGNHFKIRIRNILPQNEMMDNQLEKIIKECMESLESNGFVNYFGYQRFGPLHDNIPLLAPLIGLYLHLDKPKKAVEVLFKPTVEFDRYREGKEYFTRTGDVRGTIPLMTGATRELTILKALEKYGTGKFGCRGAFLSLPHEARSMYAHSFASLLWNHLASYRIQEYGNSPVEGDLVLGDSKRSVRDRVIPITSEDIKNRRYTMKDVLLPIPGYQVTLPLNKVGGRTTELLGALGLSLLSFRWHRYIKSVPGTYRTLISYPREFKWNIGTAPPLSSVEQQLSRPPCIDLEFKLNSGAYVTTMLHEVLL